MDSRAYNRLTLDDEKRGEPPLSAAALSWAQRVGGIGAVVSVVSSCRKAIFSSQYV